MTEAVATPVIKFFAPVNEASIHKLMAAVDERLCVPQARFLLHPVTMNFSAGASFEEAMLLEKLKSMRVDMDNCARVVAANTGKTARQVTAAMRSRTTLDPHDAKHWGLVHEIRQELFPAGASVVSITP